MKFRFEQLVMFRARRWLCWLLGHYVPVFTSGRSLVNGSGDDYDQFGYCDYCEKYCHRDSHMYGDMKWRKET